jgi:hypothetical protein
VMEGLYVGDLLMLVLLNISNVFYRCSAEQSRVTLIWLISTSILEPEKKKDLSKEGNNSDCTFLIVPIINNLHWMAHQIPSLVVCTISHNGSNC